MTKEQIVSLNIGINPIDDKAVLMIESGLEWIKENTDIGFNTLEDLPANVKLFLVKYCEIQSMNTGISSESKEGLSLSFNSNNKASLIWDIAESLLGRHLKGQVRFIQASPKWR